MCPKMWNLPLLPFPCTLSSCSTFPIPTRVSKLSSWSFYSRFTIHDRDGLLAVCVDWLPVDCPLISETEADHCGRCIHSLFQTGEFSQVTQAGPPPNPANTQSNNVIHTHTHSQRQDAWSGGRHEIRSRFESHGVRILLLTVTQHLSQKFTVSNKESFIVCR